MGIITKVLNRTARVRQHRWRVRPYRSVEAHIVVGGSPRSGTTLIRRILDRHPSICCGPEMNLFVPARFQFEALSALSGISAAELRLIFESSPSQAAMIDAFAIRYRTLRGKPRWAEKTPLNVRHFDWVMEHFPDVRLVHMIRDGRDVVCSAVEHPDRRWVDGRWTWELHPRSIEAHAHAWVRDTGAGMRFRGHPQYHEVRYEDLVTVPEITLPRLCEFLDEPFDPIMLTSDDPGPAEVRGTEPRDGMPVQRIDRVPPPTGGAARPDAADRGPVFTSSIGRWRRDLSGEQLESVLLVMGDRLAELGYAT